MGIKGLKNVLARYSPECTSTHTIEYFKNSTIAVDSSILLYKYLCSRNSEDAHVIGFLNKILYHGDKITSPYLKPPTQTLGWISKKNSGQDSVLDF